MSGRTELFFGPLISRTSPIGNKRAVTAGQAALPDENQSLICCVPGYRTRRISGALRNVIAYTSEMDLSKSHRFR
jgi:hypothetical protein